MRFVIVGYGRVGARTAHILEEEGHTVAVVEHDADKVERGRDRGVEIIEGDGSAETCLDEAGVASADAVGGLTGNPNVNFAACTIGKEHGCRAVMRVSEDYRTEIYERYADGVDEVIYPEQLGAIGAKNALLGGDFNAIGDLTEQLGLSVVTVPDGSPLVGQSFGDVDLGDRSRVYAHGRGRSAMTVPLPGTTIEAGDRLALILERGARAEVEAALQGA